jgi:hypothetical protein
LRRAIQASSPTGRLRDSVPGGFQPRFLTIIMPTQLDAMSPERLAYDSTGRFGGAVGPWAILSS